MRALAAKLVRTFQPDPTRALALLAPEFLAQLQSGSWPGNVRQLRNHIERFFNRLKHYRRVATRYDKTDSSFNGFLNLAAILVNLG